MIETIDATGKELFGVFELDDDGNVLYSRTPHGGSPDEHNTFVGLNYFREIAKFENREDLRLHFRRFVTSRDPADSFNFECLFGEHSVKTKIFMTKGHEADWEHKAGIVMMDIRRDGN